MANKENLPPALRPQPISSISPGNKPALNRQRDHSACRRPETPLKVKKTRENLKQHNTYADIPPPCIHAPYEYNLCSLATTSSTVPVGLENVLDHGSGADHHHGIVHTSQAFDTDSLPSDLAPAQSMSTIPTLQRQKSASRRMLSRVKQGIASRTKVSQTIKSVDSETSSLRRIAHRRKQSSEIDERTPSFEICRDSIDSSLGDGCGSVDAGTSVARSFTNLTVSTTEVFGDGSAGGLLRTASSPLEKGFVLGLSQPSGVSFSLPQSYAPEPTPRPPRCNSENIEQRVPLTVTLKVPHIDLEVISDCTTLDAHAKREVWIAISATVRARDAEVEAGSKRSESVAPTYRTDSYVTAEDEVNLVHEQTHGFITSIRLCFKPMGNCRIRDVVGRKAMKDVPIGHTCSLFIRIQVPRIRVASDCIDPDQESLFTELESIVGILETDVLHVEARYRHSLFPLDNIVSVRHICKMNRPQTSSRWSVVDGVEKQAISPEAQIRLARYLASEYPSEQALELIQDYLDLTAKEDAKVCEIRKSLSNKHHWEQGHGLDETRPSVVVTDIDRDPNNSSLPISDQFSTAPSTPVAVFGGQEIPLLSNVGNGREPSSKSLPAPNVFALPLISAPKTTTAVSAVTSPSQDTLKLRANPPSRPQDTARQLWRHIRHSSLSAKQLETITSEHVEHLEASDDSLKELRRQALANKRSVGAETLKGWKWEEEMKVQERSGEAPWM